MTRRLYSSLALIVVASAKNNGPERSFGSAYEKPRILSDTGLATGGPPVLQAQPVALIVSWRQIQALTLRPTIRTKG